MDRLPVWPCASRYVGSFEATCAQQRGYDWRNNIAAEGARYRRLKEKVLAALRAGVKTVLFPRANEKDLADIPDYVTKRLELIPVHTWTKCTCTYSKTNPNSAASIKTRPQQSSPTASAARSRASNSLSD